VGRAAFDDLFLTGHIERNLLILGVVALQAKVLEEDRLRLGRHFVSIVAK
jgi:hypothetical protein